MVFFHSDGDNDESYYHTSDILVVHDYHIDGSVQGCSNTTAIALELLISH